MQIVIDKEIWAKILRNALTRSVSVVSGPLVHPSESKLAKNNNHKIIQLAIDVNVWMQHGFTCSAYVPI